MPSSLQLTCKIGYANILQAILEATKLRRHIHSEMDPPGCIPNWVRTLAQEFYEATQRDNVMTSGGIHRRMPLTRKVRRIGGSLVVAVPKDFVDLYDVDEGDAAEFEPLGERTFRIKLLRQDRDQTGR